jgi:GNAT superfamily N-acetyltransferase
MYASVLVEGEVRAGDEIALLPAVDGTAKGDALLWARFDHAVQESNLKNWLAARAGGIDVRILDDGDITVAATPAVPGQAFNSACGLRQFPNLLPMVLDHFHSNGTAGWLPMHEPPWPGAEPEERLSILASTPDAVPSSGAPEGFSIRRLEAREAGTWASILASGTQLGEVEAAAWQAAAPHLLSMRDVHVLVAYRGDEPLATGALHVNGKLGFLRAGVVLPHARGRGLQRALIAARARLAAEVGADALATAASPGSISERNLVACGFRPLGVRDVYRFDPAAEPRAARSAG